MTRTLQEFSADARWENIRPLRNMVARMAEDEGVAASSIADLEVCVTEALANVVRHAYGSEPGRLHVCVTRLEDELEVVVRDEGRGLAAERKPELGRGLEIINRLTRRSSVTSKPGEGTEVQLVFALDGGRVADPLARRAARPLPSGRAVPARSARRGAEVGAGRGSDPSSR